MLGAVLGDIIGSYYEEHNVKTKGFPFVTGKTRYTDDTVMTLAVAKWLMEDTLHSKEGLICCMQKLGRAHLNAGYGHRFKEWLMSPDPQPYNSWGNGSAMRVSPVGLYATSLEEALSLAEITASVSHNHPEGIKGAQAVAACVFLNKTSMDGKSSNDFRRKCPIVNYIEKTFGYDIIHRKLDDIRPTYTFDVSCQGSVPQAIRAYLESKSLEDCVRNAISIGGDSDTIAAIACSIYMAFGGSDLAENAWANDFERFLPNDLKRIMQQFERVVYPSTPIFNSYKVTDQIFAGEYPGDKNEETAREKIKSFQRFGITHFIDLTEEGELRPYKEFLPASMKHTRFAIKDQSVPDDIEPFSLLIEQILDEVRQHPNAKIYIHCWGGVGRTGTVVACLLTKMYCLDYNAVMQEFNRLWETCPKSEWRVSPENNEQREFIARFVEERDKEKQTDALLLWSYGLGHMGKYFNGENPMPQKTVKATPDRWHTSPMPDEHVIILTDVTIPADAMEIIRMGHVPEAMEDHWFMYCDDYAIRYFRSWTGYCIYEAHYEKVEDGYKINRLIVNRSKMQYGQTDDRKDYCLFMYLLLTEAGGDGSMFWEEYAR